MGVIQKKLYVDGINLANYGLYITGQSAFNAPQRDVELVSIPGRNGDYIIDNGRFQNIEVTYPAGLREDATAFATRVAEIRNILASRHRYVRIEDDYNPDEYREGMFVSGLEVTPACDNIAGQFDLVFNCKPQRFLKSGETKTAVASGGTITNPTAFESKPLIEFGGYGTMTVNGYAVTLNSGPIGNITLANATSMGTNNTQTFSTASLNTGDAISFGVSEAQLTASTPNSKVIDSVTFTQSGALDVTPNLEYTSGSSRTLLAHFIVGNTTPFSCVKGTTKTQSGQVVATVTFTDNTSTTVTYDVTCVYDTNAETIKITCVILAASMMTLQRSYQLGAVTGYSTQTALGSPIYVDCELGDCYKIENGEMVFLNSYVSMPNDLPVLASGSNAVSYDNTITSFKITPRWWQI